VKSRPTRKVRRHMDIIVIFGKGESYLFEKVPLRDVSGRHRSKRKSGPFAQVTISGVSDECLDSPNIEWVVEDPDLDGYGPEEHYESAKVTKLTSVTIIREEEEVSK